MTLFQWLLIPVLGALFLWEFVGWLRGTPRLNFRLFRCLVWLGALAGVCDPDLVQHLATALGIGRGADVLLYLFVLAFLASTFFFYGRYVRLQREVTLLVRHIALANPRHGVPPPGAEKPSDAAGA